MRKAIAAGKHIYCEKPIADDARRRRSICTSWPQKAGVKHGVVQDKLWLPGLAEAEDAEGPGLLRRDLSRARRVRLLGVRRRYGSGAAAVLELPQGRRRRHHPRHAVPLALCARQSIRASEGGLVPGRDAYSGALGRSRASRTSAPPTIPLTPPSSWTAASSRISTPPGACACGATTCSPCRWTARRAPRWRACATAGSSTTARRRGPCGIPISRAR